MDRYEIFKQIEDLLDSGLNDLDDLEFEMLLCSVDDLIQRYD